MLLLSAQVLPRHIMLLPLESRIIFDCFDPILCPEKVFRKLELILESLLKILRE